jgi:glycosyltransferase involved in cell wall biosynthesis
MAAAKPVISTRWRGINDIVVDSETGYLCPIQDPVAIADALTRLLQSQDSLEEFGRRARARYQSEYTKSRFYRNVESILDALTHAE